MKSVLAILTCMWSSFVFAQETRESLERELQRLDIEITADRESAIGAPDVARKRDVATAAAQAFDEAVSALPDVAALDAEIAGLTAQLRLLRVRRAEIIASNERHLAELQVAQEDSFQAYRTAKAGGDEAMSRVRRRHAVVRLLARTEAE